MLIGINGKAQTGKSTVGEYLHDTHGFNVHAFADKLRELAYETNPMIECSGGKDKHDEWNPYYAQNVDFYGYEETKKKGEARAFLQNLGVAARKTFGANFWVDQLFHEFSNKYGIYTKDLDHDGIQSHIVVTDVRFPNEAEAIRHYGGVVVKLERDVPAVREHESEQILKPHLIDYLVDNNGTKKELYKYIEEILSKEKFIRY